MHHIPVSLLLQGLALRLLPLRVLALGGLLLLLLLLQEPPSLDFPLLLLLLQS
jgi:hypothetical protein